MAPLEQPSILVGLPNLEREASEHLSDFVHFATNHIYSCIRCTDRHRLQFLYLLTSLLPTGRVLCRLSHCTLQALHLGAAAHPATP